MLDLVLLIVLLLISSLDAFNDVCSIFYLPFHHLYFRLHSACFLVTSVNFVLHSIDSLVDGTYDRYCTFTVFSNVAYELRHIFHRTLYTFHMFL